MALTPNWRKPRAAEALPAMREWGDMARTVVLGKTKPMDEMKNQSGRRR